MACAAICLAPSICRAQTPEDLRRDAQMHFGPLYLTPRLALKEFGVDTNVFNNGEDQRDFTVTLAPHANAWVPFGRRALLTTGAGADVVYYQQFASERSINPDLRVRTDVYLGRVKPFAELTYLRTRQRPNYEIDVRSLRHEKLFRAGADIRVFSKIGVQLVREHRPVTYGADATYNDVALRESLNRTTTSKAVVVSYAYSPLTTFTVKTESLRDRFELAPLRDADSFRVLPGVELKTRALISGSAHVGFRRFSPLNESLEPFSGLVASSSLSYTLQGVTRITATVDRDLTYSYERVQPYFVVDSLGLAVRRQIAGPFDASLSLQRQQYSYRDLLLAGATAADLDRKDTMRAWTAGIGYRIGRGMRAGFNLQYRQRQSNSVRFRDYDGFRMLSTVDYEL